VDFEDGAVKLIQSFQQFIVAGDADVVAFRICRPESKGD
jgi:hypothetical protein